MRHKNKSKITKSIQILLVAFTLLTAVSLFDGPVHAAKTIIEEDTAKAGRLEPDYTDSSNSSLAGLTHSQELQIPDNTLLIIDISGYQLPDLIDYDLISSQIDGVVLRIGYTGWGTGESYYGDAEFDRHYSEFKKRSVPVGGYWYSCADTVEEGIAEANFTLELIKGKKFELPIYWDTEDQHHQAKTTRKILTDTGIAYLDKVADAGYKVGLYASANWYKDRLDISRLLRYEIWVAHWYVSEPNFNYAYDMWQFTDRGRLKGYNGNLDFNYRSKQSFSDVPLNHWAYNVIEDLHTQGIIHGYGDSGEFRPNNKLTREHAAKMIAIAANLSYKGKIAPFPDVDPTNMFSPHIAALAEKGAINGFPNGDFRPQKNIKRSHVAKIVARAFDIRPGTKKVNFSDVPADHDFYNIIMTLASNGIVSGYGETDEFRPNNPVTRAEFSKMVSRAQEVSKAQKSN